MPTDQADLAGIIARRLRSRRDSLRAQWLDSGSLRHFFQDDLLPEDFVRGVSKGFPQPGELLLRSSLRERKRVGVDIQRYSSDLRECLFAFQQAAVVQAVSEITGLQELEPDPTLYASGISVMGRGDFLDPHLDNSHDGDGRRYRALNLLFYVSPDWKPENGGNLELWDRRVRRARALPSRFNRLVVMATDNASWHSVSRVLVHQPRCCISNYYFSVNSPLGGKPYTQVTTFAGRPEQPLKRLFLWGDSFLRNLGGRLLPNYRKRSKHRTPVR